MKTPILIRGPKGFTLPEIMVALVVSGILLIVLMRFYSESANSYSLQEQLAEMNQNAKFVMQEISNVLSQAGSDCLVISNTSTDRDTIVKLTGTGPVYNEFTIKVNPRGGLYLIPTAVILNTTTSCSLSVDDATNFKYATQLARIPVPGAKDSAVKIYNLIGLNELSNKLCIGGGKTSTDTFAVNDAVYSFVNNRYYLHGTDLCLNNDTNVLAENIDTLQIAFYTSTGDSTFGAKLPWNVMRSVNLRVDATTPVDYRYPGDHKRHLALGYQFRLKNKVGATL